MSQFTKKAINESFLRLLNSTPFDKITVKDIVDECGVNRNTFYYYYQDIYALLEELLREETEKVFSSDADFDSWYDGLVKSAKFAFENKKAIYHLYNSLNREILEKYLYGITGHFMLRFVKKLAVGTNASEGDIACVVDFYKSALVGLILGWLADGMRDESLDKLKRMSEILDGSIKAALEKC